VREGGREGRREGGREGGREEKVGEDLPCTYLACANLNPIEDSTD
jgi:hypothetical protein